MNPVEQELMEGMCNCYSVCGEGFEETVKMVASARKRTPTDVKQTLIRLARENGSDRYYRELRNRLPAGFPF